MSIEGSSDQTSRRRFFHQLGLGSSAIGLFAAFGELAVATPALAQCDALGSGTAQEWRRDCRPIRPRRPASSLTPTELKKLRDGYAAMRALDVTDPTDPRGFRQQANIHCWYCGGGTQIHGSWQFFPWHRAYLYFHERILGTLIGDPDLRLPYWDWDSAAHRRIPPGYAAAADATNPLWNGTRTIDPTADLLEEDVGDLVMEAALTAEPFSEFGGTATSDGIPEGAPHGSVHVAVGGDMRTFARAGRDPVFYAHHSNIDKMWSDWNRASSMHTNPTAAAFLGLRWNFFDENKRWRSISAAQLLSHENQLRYVYGPSKLIEILPCLLDWVRIPIDWRSLAALRLNPPTSARILRVLENGGRARLHLQDVQVPINKSAVYRVYLDPEAAQADDGPRSDSYLGTIPVVLFDEQAHHRHKATRNAVFIVSKRTIDTLSRAQKPAVLSLVERGAKPEERKVIRIRARDVYFSIAEVQR